MSEKPEAENAGAVWIIVTISLLCLAVIAGCPQVRRPRVQQQISGWDCELIENSLVTTTNGMIIFETGGAK